MRYDVNVLFYDLRECVSAKLKIEMEWNGNKNHQHQAEANLFGKGSNRNRIYLLVDLIRIENANEDILHISL